MPLSHSLIVLFQPVPTAIVVYKGLILAVYRMLTTYHIFPLKEMGKVIGFKLYRHPQGRKPLFLIEGEVVLMFLHAYTGLSDDGLVGMLNGNLHMQMFCGVLINPFHPLKDGKSPVPFATGSPPCWT